VNKDRLTKERFPRPSDGRGIKGEGSKDRLSAERRSWNMSRIRGKDTTPERLVRSLLHKMGYRFRLHVRIPIPAPMVGTWLPAKASTSSHNLQKGKSGTRWNVSLPRFTRSVSVDILLPKYKTAIFVHGCFWHRHKGCKNCTTPTHRREFWLAKLNGNAARDKINQRVLKKLGWRVIVIWECEADKKKMIQRIAKQLRKIQLIPPDDAHAPSNP
jgi:DNA mismatch endonuclease (patch repair protein)